MTHRIDRTRYLKFLDERATNRPSSLWRTIQPKIEALIHDESRLRNRTSKALGYCAFPLVPWIANPQSSPPNSEEAGTLYNDLSCVAMDLGMMSVIWTAIKSLKIGTVRADKTVSGDDPTLAHHLEANLSVENIYEKLDEIMLQIGTHGPEVFRQEILPDIRDDHDASFGYLLALTDNPKTIADGQLEQAVKNFPIQACATGIGETYIELHRKFGLQVHWGKAKP